MHWNIEELSIQPCSGQWVCINHDQGPKFYAVENPALSAAQYQIAQFYVEDYTV